jgi:hypothetical protein
VQSDLGLELPAEPANVQRGLQAAMMAYPSFPARDAASAACAKFFAVVKSMSGRSSFLSPFITSAKRSLP